MPAKKYKGAMVDEIAAGRADPFSEYELEMFALLHAYFEKRLAPLRAREARQEAKEARRAERIAERVRRRAERIARKGR